MIIEELHYTLYKKDGKDRKNIIYYYSYKDENGKWHNRSTGCTTERKARIYVNTLIKKGTFKKKRTS